MPICGVALGMAGVAGICNVWSSTIAYIAAVISALLLITYVARCAKVKGSFSKDLSAPVSSCVFGTFPMTLMILSQYVPDPFNGLVLILGVEIQVALMFYIATRFRAQLKENLHACIFVPYVGIAAAGISGPSVGFPELGAICAVAAIVMAVPMMFLVLRRYVTKPVTEKAVMPLFCISAAPFAICTVALANSVPGLDEWLGDVIYFAGLALYIAVLLKIPSFLRLGFIPSFASMTFPLTISALASHTASMFIGNAELAHYVDIIFMIQAVIAVAMTLYVLFRMLMFTRSA